MRMYRKVKINFINLKLIKVEKYKDFLFLMVLLLKGIKKFFIFSNYTSVNKIIFNRS